MVNRTPCVLVGDFLHLLWCQPAVRLDDGRSRRSKFLAEVWPHLKREYHSEVLCSTHNVIMKGIFMLFISIRIKFLDVKTKRILSSTFVISVSYNDRRAHSALAHLDVSYTKTQPFVTVTRTTLTKKYQLRGAYWRATLLC